MEHGERSQELLGSRRVEVNEAMRGLRQAAFIDDSQLGAESGPPASLLAMRLRGDAYMSSGATSPLDLLERSFSLLNGMVKVITPSLGEDPIFQCILKDLEAGIKGLKEMGQ